MFRWDCFVYVMLCVSGSFAQEAIPPWVWHSAPGPIGNIASVEVERVLLIVVEEDTPATRGLKRAAAWFQDGTLAITVKEEEGCELRPAAFDRGAERVELVYAGGVWHPAGMYHSWYPAARKESQEVCGVEIHTIGVEKLTLEEQKKAALASGEKLKTEYHTILPYPVAGRPYHLKFTGDDGQVVEIETLRGSTVVIDWWATWCGPCMAKMPWLMALSDRYRGGKVVFVSVSFDESREQAVSALKRCRQSDPAVAALAKLGLELDAPDLPSAAAAALEKAGVNLKNEDSRQTALETLRALGLDVWSSSEGGVLKRLGLDWQLSVVPKDQCQLWYGAVGNNALPQLFIIGPDGVLKWHGHPGGEHSQRSIEELLEKLIRSP